MKMSGRNVVVLGLGVTGMSAARWAARHHASVRVVDTRPDPPRARQLADELPHVPLVSGPIDEASLRGADMIVISPGLARRQPAIEAAVARGVELVGDVELFARAMPPAQKLLAVTGSNGKTTVSTLLADLARAAGLEALTIGNIGEPVLDILAAYEGGAPWPDVFIVELSSFQLETTSHLHATAATVLNVSENHLDRYDGMEDYASAKARILTRADAQVLNRDDPRSIAMALPEKLLITFGDGVPASAQEWGIADCNDSPWLAHGDDLLLSTRDLTLVGRHNVLNALAALAMLSTVAHIDAAVLLALARFRSLSNRMERVAEIEGVLFVNDSKGTTVAATQAALEGLGRPTVLIAGGDGKGQQFAPLKASVDAYAHSVILLGRDAPAIAAALAGTQARVEHVESIDAAVVRAIAHARRGDAVLLSPACASLDMFRDYVERGERFKAAIAQHAGEVWHA
jgi:UDP-N-acetylmuramoylalanine--D-glutamate ligase